MVERAKPTMCTHCEALASLVVGVMQTMTRSIMKLAPS